MMRNIASISSLLLLSASLGFAGSTQAAQAQGTASMPFTVTHASNNSKMVFAHYLPAMPRSYDNLPAQSDRYSTDYLSIAGEGGKHTATGGFLRDRPLPRASLSEDWRLQDMLQEIKNAKSAGIDGFLVDVLDYKGDYWPTVQELLTAADKAGNFSIVATPDMTTSTGSLSPADMASMLHDVSLHPSAYRINGKLVFAPFATEKKDASYWAAVKSQLHSRYRVPSSLIAQLLDTSNSSFDSLKSVADGYSDWGVKDEVASRSVDPLAQKTHSLGKKWLAPVNLGDYSPAERIYDESRGAKTLQNTWDRASDESADMVVVDTWNDFIESTAIEPSQDHGFALSDINAYYATAFHNGGTKPIITADESIVISRTQKVGYTMGQQEPALLRPGSATAPNDEVEGVVFLKSPASVTLISGVNRITVTEPSGFSELRVPLDFGTPTITVSRKNAIVSSATLPKPVVATASRQDLTYYAGSSRTN